MSLRRAINAKCKDCTYDDCAPGSWRAQVAQCSAIHCPLWPYRPAPSAGDFAHPPRNPETVSREWVKLPVGEAKSPPNQTEPAQAIQPQGVDP